MTHLFLDQKITTHSAKPSSSWVPRRNVLKKFFWRSGRIYTCFLIPTFRDVFGVEGGPDRNFGSFTQYLRCSILTKKDALPEMNYLYRSVPTEKWNRRFQNWKNEKTSLHRSSQTGLVGRFILGRNESLNTLGKFRSFHQEKKKSIVSEIDSVQGWPTSGFLSSVVIEEYCDIIFGVQGVSAKPHTAV